MHGGDQLAVLQERTAELQRDKADAEAERDIARGAASGAQRAAERAQAERASQEARANALDEELKRTSEALQQERRAINAKVRGDPHIRWMLGLQFPTRLYDYSEFAESLYPQIGRAHV